MKKFGQWITRFFIVLVATALSEVHAAAGKAGVKAVILYMYDDATVGSNVVSMEVDKSTFMNVIKDSQFKAKAAKPMKFGQDNGFFALLEGESSSFSFATAFGIADCNCKCTREATTTPFVTTSKAPEVTTTSARTVPTTREATTPIRSTPIVSTTGSGRIYTTSTAGPTYLPPTTFNPCPSGGSGPFCCKNGAENKDCCLNGGKGAYCCLNGENNPDCLPKTTAGTKPTTTKVPVTTSRPVVTPVVTPSTGPTYLPPTTKPEECPNGGSGPYCCSNGANNKDCCVNGGKGTFCCLNGENNAECLPRTTSGTKPTTSTKPTTTTRPVVTPSTGRIITETTTVPTGPTYLPPTSLPDCPKGGSGPYCCKNGAKNVDCCENGGKGAFCCTNGENNPGCVKETTPATLRTTPSTAPPPTKSEIVTRPTPPPKCPNGGSGAFCCTNGAENKDCCENGGKGKYCCLNGLNVPGCASSVVPTIKPPFKGPTYLPIPTVVTSPRPTTVDRYTFGTWSHVPHTYTWTFGPWSRDPRRTTTSYTTTPVPLYHNGRPLHEFDMIGQTNAL